MSKLVVFRTVGGLYTAAGVFGAVVSGYMSVNAWAVDASRCGALPDEYYPELFGAMMSLPATLLLAISGALLIASTRANRRSLTVGALVAAALATIATIALGPWWIATSACPA